MAVCASSAVLYLTNPNFSRYFPWQSLIDWMEPKASKSCLNIDSSVVSGKPATYTFVLPLCPGPAAGATFMPQLNHRGCHCYHPVRRHA